MVCSSVAAVSCSLLWPGAGLPFGGRMVQVLLFPSASSVCRPLVLAVLLLLLGPFLLSSGGAEGEGLLILVGMPGFLGDLDSWFF